MAAVKLKPIKLVLCWKRPALLCATPELQCKKQRSPSSRDPPVTEGGVAPALLGAFPRGFEVTRSRNAFRTMPRFLSYFPSAFSLIRSSRPFQQLLLSVRGLHWFHWFHSLHCSRCCSPPNASHPAQRSGRTSAPGSGSRSPHGSDVVAPRR